MAGCANGGDAGKRGKSLQDLFVEFPLARINAVTWRKRDARSQQIFSTVARINIEQFYEAADEQTRADQQHNGHRDLDHHQHAAQASPVISAAPSAFFERVVQIRM